jgi:hypothetical protein
MSQQLTVAQPVTGLRIAQPGQEDRLVIRGGVQRVVAQGVGAQGRPGRDGGSDIQREAGENLGGHVVVFVDTENRAFRASPATAEEFRPVGMTVGATMLGDTALIRVLGEITEPSWSWDVGPVFLGANGVPTQAPPASGAVFQIGVASGPTRISLALQLVAVID